MLAGLLALTGVLLAASVAGAAERRTPFGFLGATAGAPLVERWADADAEFAEMARNGVEAVRLPVYWWDLQPNGPGPIDTTKTDPVVAAAARARITVLAVVLGTPPWARTDPQNGTSPPRDPKDYGRVVGALVDRYGPAGSFWAQRPSLPRVPLRDWQIWNEPDNGNYWTPQPFEKPYVALLRQARNAIKGRDRGGRVVLAGFATRTPTWPVLRRIHDAGGRGLYDVVGIHPYTMSPNNVVKLVRFARTRLRSLGAAKVPLWATEVTWPASRGRVDTNYGFEVDQRTQARRIAEVLPKLAAVRRSLGLERVYWEAWITGYRDPNNAFDFSGLRQHRDGRPGADRPGLAEFRKAARRMQGCAKTADARRCVR